MPLNVQWSRSKHSLKLGNFPKLFFYLNSDFSVLNFVKITISHIEFFFNKKRFRIEYVFKKRLDGKLELFM